MIMCRSHHLMSAMGGNATLAQRLNQRPLTPLAGAHCNDRDGRLADLTGSGRKETVCFAARQGETRHSISNGLNDVK